MNVFSIYLYISAIIRPRKSVVKPGCVVINFGFASVQYVLYRLYSILAALFIVQLDHPLPYDRHYKSCLPTYSQL